MWVSWKKPRCFHLREFVRSLELRFVRIEAARLAMDLCVLDTAINAVSAGFRCLGLSSQLQVQIAMICGFSYRGSAVSGICHAKSLST